MTGAEYLAFLGAAVVLAVTPGPDTFLTLRFGSKGWRPGFLYSCAVATGIVLWAVLTLTVLGALLDALPWLLEVLTYLGAAYLLYLGITSILSGRRQLREVRPDPGSRTVVEVAAGTADLATAVEAPRPLHAPVPAGVSGSTGRTDTSGGEITDFGADAAFRNTASAPNTVMSEPAGAQSARQVRSKTDRNPYMTGILSGITNPKTGLFFLALLPPFLPAAPGAVDYVLLVATLAVTIFVYSLLLVGVAAKVGRWINSPKGPGVIDLVAGSVLAVLAVLIVVTH
ncbi:LysE family translocator [Brevibacterium litoralis]|uniref:LysE family translocator n=1 Tax=Brevibacterium litoralis TaxID=3138935 RepID=UPI0032EF6582